MSKFKNIILACFLVFVIAVGLGAATIASLEAVEEALVEIVYEDGGQVPSYPAYYFSATSTEGTISHFAIARINLYGDTIAYNAGSVGFTSYAYVYTSTVANLTHSHGWGREIG